MATRDALAEAALDTLPITVAVLDGNGNILLTNRAWDELDRDGKTDHVGVNYVATARMAEQDEYARRAADGLEAVLAGDRDSVSMEYPCQTPAQKQWFLMRASRFTVDGEDRVAVLHLEITDRKLAEIEADEAAQRLREEQQSLEHVLERVDGLVRDVTDAAVGATSRDEIERRVCQRLTATDPYVLAWVGRVDVTAQRISPREWAGRDDVPLETDELVLSSDETHPAVSALDAGESQVIQDVGTFEDADQWWPTGAGEWFQSVAAVPLEYGDVTYGVLVLFAEEAEVVDDRELLVLESLAGTVSTAMNAIEARRMLTTETVVELEVAIEDSSLFVGALATDLEASVTYRGLTYDRDGTALAFFYVDQRDGVADVAASLDGVTEATVLSEYGDGALLELALSDDVVTAIGDHGGVIQRLDAAPNNRVVDLALQLPNGQSTRSIYNVLEERYDRVELLSYHESDQPTQTPRDVLAKLDSELTDRQAMALRKAFYSEYFEWPRGTSGEELAESMGVSRSTFHQHLRAAQQKLLAELFAVDPTSEG
ncbi:bacterio-opsin activator domain-containing protein [Natronobacterium gregoryi]|uniref:DNA binding protein n=2 Tax=Natronobacterium gregoryi TaxID=44930 RepID=L0AHV1_NATGS|nr:bacterio-opsin activator domain-containing protein [Natronobacterium gregoryi]AFZ73386.1 putative DNA binding protein [Natronobacterium gregoryi SP2]ELY68582.1 PAS/PAC sensor protein [Natronobacterium gregoryi SP2]PLK19666.1 histidine kinase [Natronobacterium gregoryi SP2]SFI73501.1 PAS fold-containing protein [Natronobacterium gregoryi]